MDHLDTVNLQLIAAMGELRMAAVCLPTDAEKAEPIRRHLLAAEKRVIEAHKAASAAATEHRPPVGRDGEAAEPAPFLAGGDDLRRDGRAVARG